MSVRPCASRFELRAGNVLSMAITSSLFSAELRRSSALAGLLLDESGFALRARHRGDPAAAGPLAEQLAEPQRSDGRRLGSGRNSIRPARTGPRAHGHQAVDQACFAAALEQRHDLGEGAGRRQGLRRLGGNRGGGLGREAAPRPPPPPLGIAGAAAPAAAAPPPFCSILIACPRRGEVGARSRGGSEPSRRRATARAPPGSPEGPSAAASTPA